MEIRKTSEEPVVIYGILAVFRQRVNRRKKIPVDGERYLFKKADTGSLKCHPVYVVTTIFGGSGSLCCLFIGRFPWDLIIALKDGTHAIINRNYVNKLPEVRV